jgi:hypothetical protein
VGLYDIEDAIPNHIWIKYVKDNCDIDLSDKFLDDEIRSNLRSDSQGKFYKLLQDHVAKNNNNQKYLPTKGTESGSLLAKYFLQPDDIPQVICSLFDQIKN